MKQKLKVFLAWIVIGVIIFGVITLATTVITDEKIDTIDIETSGQINSTNMIFQNLTCEDGTCEILSNFNLEDYNLTIETVNGIFYVESNNASDIQNVVNNLPNNGAMIIPYGDFPLDDEVTLKSNITIINRGNIYWNNSASPSNQYGNSVVMFVGLDVENVNFFNEGILQPKYIYDVPTYADDVFYFNNSIKLRIDMGKVDFVSHGLRCDFCNDSEFYNLKADQVSQVGIVFSCSKDLFIHDIVVDGKGSASTEAVDSNGYSRYITINNVEGRNAGNQEVVDSSSDKYFTAKNIKGVNVNRIFSIKNISSTLAGCPYALQTPEYFDLEGSCYNCSDRYDIKSAVNNITMKTTMNDGANSGIPFIFNPIYFGEAEPAGLPLGYKFYFEGNLTEASCSANSDGGFYYDDDLKQFAYCNGTLNKYFNDWDNLYNKPRDLTQDILMAYNFNNKSISSGTIFDSGIENNDITYTGGSWDINGGFNNFGAIDDDDDSFVANHTLSGLNLSEGTVCVNFKYNDLTNNDIIFKSDSEGAGSRLKLYLYSSGGHRIRAELGNGGVLQTSGNVASGNWYDVCLVWGDYNTKLYVNSVLEETEAGNFTSFQTLQHIGSSGSDSFLNGTIDNLIYYNKAFTDYDVKRRYETNFEVEDAILDKSIGYTGSCANSTTLTVVNGLITGCS